MFPPNIKAICFDAFGTLVEISEKRWPFKTLLEELPQNAAKDLRYRIMREELSLEELLRKHESALTKSLKLRLRSELATEIASIKIRVGMNNIWEQIKNEGYKIALCSNLALDYGDPLLELLPETPDAKILSYKVGHIKPEHQIYQSVCDSLGLPPEAILFSGDTELADVTGPRSFGMSSEFIDDLMARVNTISG